MCVLRVCAFTPMHVCTCGEAGRGQPQMLLFGDHPSWFGDLELAEQARAACLQALGTHLPVPAGCCDYKQGPAPHSHYTYATPPPMASYAHVKAWTQSSSLPSKHLTHWASSPVLQGMIRISHLEFLLYRCAGAYLSCLNSRDGGRLWGCEVMPTWSTEWVQGQIRPHSETLS